jgi:hypothetical protein
MAEGWMHSATDKALREAADPKCPFCKGTGKESREESDAPFLNLANQNARALFTVLGIDPGEDLLGECPLAEAKRALIRAKNSNPEKWPTFKDQVTTGAPRKNEDGTVTLRPVHIYTFGLDEERMSGYISRFEQFLSEVEKRGATLIKWA